MQMRPEGNLEHHRGRSVVHACPLVAFALIPLVSLFVASLSSVKPATSTALSTSARTDPPNITWAPPMIALVMPPGAVRTVNVSLTSRDKIQDAAVEAEPQIANFLSLRPNTFATLPAGKPKQIQIAFSIPSGTNLGIYQGTVYLRSGASTIPQTLKVSLNVTAEGVALSVPQSFQVDSGLIDLGGPISLDNFEHQYYHGGIIPTGGAEINITSVTLPRSLTDFIANENHGQGISIASASEITVSGSAATEVVSIDMYTSTSGITMLALKRIAVYIPKNRLLFKIYLTYNAGDPRESQFLASFRQLLGSVQFTP